MSIITAQEIKSVVKLALPLMAAFLAQKGMQLIDTVMMGWIGPQAIAAGALAMTTFMTLVVFCMGTLSSVGIFSAYGRGANISADVVSALQHGVCLALLLAAPCMLIVWHLPQLLAAAGEEPSIVHNSQLLLHGLVWGMPGLLMFLMLREFVASFGLARVVMIINCVSLPLTFIGNYALIYGRWGFPALGIAGIGIAGATIMWLMFLGVFFYSKTHPILRSYINQWLPKKINYHKIKDMLRVGAPSGVLFILDMGMFTVAAVMIGYFGADSLAAYQITMQCASIAFAAPFALSMATALLVGHAMGADRWLQAKRYAYFGYSVGLVIAAVIALLFILTPEMLIHVFISSDAGSFIRVNQQAHIFLTIAALFLCFDAVQIIATGILKGCKDTLIPMLLSTGCYWVVGIGSAYYLAFHTDLAARGIWYGLTLGICSTGIVLTWRFLLRFRGPVSA